MIPYMHLATKGCSSVACPVRPPQHSGIPYTVSASHILGEHLHIFRNASTNNMNPTQGPCHLGRENHTGQKHVLKIDNGWKELRITD